MEYYSAMKNKWTWASWIEVDEQIACYIEWSKSKRKREVSYINAYMWNLENGANEPIFRVRIETQK